MRITGEIHQVGGGKLTAPEDAAIYLINFQGHAALVDAGCGRAQPRLLDNIRACGVDPEQIEFLLLTHCHFDHTGGARALGELLGCRIVAHALEAPFLEHGHNAVTAAAWYGAILKPFAVDHQLSGAREEISLGGRVIEALHTPGHSPGAVCLYCPELGVLFSGDTLFSGGPGATGRSFSDFPTIVESIDMLITELPADTVVHTGHGDSTTLAAEAPHRQEWLDRGH